MFNDNTDFFITQASMEENKGLHDNWREEKAE